MARRPHRADRLAAAGIVCLCWQLFWLPVWFGMQALYRFAYAPILILVVAGHLLAVVVILTACVDLRRMTRGEMDRSGRGVTRRSAIAAGLSIPLAWVVIVHSIWLWT